MQQKKPTGFLILFGMHGTCDVKFFHSFVYCSSMWHCWHGIFFTKIFSAYFLWCVLCKSILNEQCSSQNVSQGLVKACTVKTQYLTGQLPYGAALIKNMQLSADFPCLSRRIVFCTQGSSY